MSKKEEFKEFAKKHPELVSHIKSGNATWQSLYEIYDIYGESNEAWQSYYVSKQDTDIINNASSKIESTGKITSLNDLTKAFKNADVKNIQKHIGTAQKAIGLFQELTTKSAGAGGVLGALASKPTATRPLNKFFED